MSAQPQHPIYIPSKGRALHATTPEALDRLGVPYSIVVEDFERDAYAARFGEAKLLVLPQRYIDEYDPLDGLGLSKPPGSGPPRNFSMDHAQELGHSWCWSVDDNILFFGYMNRNQRIPAGDGTIFAAMEDFTGRYLNVGCAGPDYWWFVKARNPQKSPYVLNRRVMSCMLMLMCIRYLKAGWCTVCFRAFLQCKARTQTVPGGMNGDLYSKDPGGGTLYKSQLLVREHPDIARMQRRFGRVHHWSDWSQFADMTLVRDPAWQPPASNPYDMAIVDAGQTARVHKYREGRS